MLSGVNPNALTEEFFGVVNFHIGFFLPLENKNTAP